MTKKKIIEIIKAEIAEQLNFDTLDKLSHSPYYVKHIIDRIGKIAFDANYELTCIEQDEILATVFREA